MSSDSNEPTSFRDRLAAIPSAKDEPIDLDWDRAEPPVSRPNAPVARPGHSVYDAGPQSVYDAGPESVYDAEQSSVYDAQHDSAHDRFFDDSNREWPAAANDVDSPDFDQQIQSSPYPGNREIRKRRRRWPFLLLLLLTLLALAVVIPLFVANRTFASIDRVEVSNALAEPLPAGTNILLVGTDSRDGIQPDNVNAGAILGGEVVGLRSDTIMVLRIGEQGSSFLSLPRDLWLPIQGGDSGRINGAIGRGPDVLINTVQSELGIPISHYVQVDFAGFLNVVDALGGVEITIENPATDRRSGLNLPVAGPVLLDSDQALAYVRSRAYTEIVDGTTVVDGTGDLGRVERQQVFMRALMDKVAAERNPATLNATGDAIANSLTLDDSTTLLEALALLNQIRSAQPVSVTLPTTPTTVGAASVLVLNEDSAEVLAAFMN